MATLSWTAPTAQYNADEDKWSRMASRWWADGIYISSEGTDNFLPSAAASGGMSVNIGTGDAIIRGFHGYGGALTAMGLSAANASNPRYDRIVLRLTDTAPYARITLEVLTGVAASNPAPPALTNSQTVKDIKVAKVYVAPGAGTIIASNITDEREYSKLRLMGSYTPLAVGSQTASAGNTGITADAGHRHALDQDGAGAILIPAGLCVPYAGAHGPSGGWLWANGQAVSRAAYPALWAAIGTTWGSGNGTTTFNVPNLNGKFVSGPGDGRASLGNSGGQDAWTLTTGQLPNFRPTVNGVDALNVAFKAASSSLWLVTDVLSPGSGRDTGNPVSFTKIDTIGGNESHPTLPEYVSMNWIIKAH